MDNFYQTNITPTTHSSEVARHKFLIQSLLSRVRTSMPVEVIAVTNDGGVAPIGYVDLQPLVSQVDGKKNVIDHAPIYNVPYLRMQGGSNAIILDPQVGDIGTASFCDRDISTVKVSKKKAAPATPRKHSMSDAVYLGTIISASGAPTQYIQFNDTGVTIHSPYAVSIVASASAEVTAPVIHANGNLKVSTGATKVVANVDGTVSQFQNGILIA